MASGADPTRRSSYRKLRMLPWCKDERDEIVHTEYIRFLAQMNAQQRSKAAKHAVVAASSLLRTKRSVVNKVVDSSAGKPSGENGEARRVAWRDEQN